MSQGISAARCVPAGRPGADPARLRAGLASGRGAPVAAAIGQGTALREGLPAAYCADAGRPGSDRAFFYRRQRLARPIVNAAGAGLKRGFAKIGTGFYRARGDGTVALLGIAVCAAGSGRTAMPVCPGFSDLAPVLVGTCLDMFKKIIERR